MFKPELGVSLHSVMMPLTAEHEGVLQGTDVRTAEVLPARFFDDERPAEGKAVLGRMLATSGVRVATVHCPFGGGLDISCLDDAVCEIGRGVLVEAIALAEELGAPMVVVHASTEPITDAERPARLRRSRESLASVADRCGESGIRVAVELLPRTCLGNTVDELLALLEGLSEEVFGVCLDVNHLMDRFADLPNVVRRLGDRLITLHLSDYDGVDEKHWMPGEGVIDWRAFMLALQEIGYTGPFNYEAKPHGDTPAEKICDLEANFRMLTALLSG
ncbi:MAG: sugar phosphate isomerase/epimerase [Lentisphaerae bacterium]|jgi:sugar phosphate isomerase/epimerase|nr:sugar phosphate isomerase/epimerase [Lentisphaerota bacterium]MBT4816166.1 sugar phosphate isomerase/epimerase [Lentisphaerota bacterium]MBT5605561.1 sugar phosphate isomerase/epimerase [Lentisphaerota bacterium]MBT7056838.1 sugar phosphate isomerase/epimerase [Lentisphaerota bacterium]MBT7845376.1 sugar phosphate isomerase/epimerase [Lentisphaerota bacterium]